MPHLLFELGCEELPASFVQNAFQQLAAEISGRLRAEGVAHGDVQSLGTPRRLITIISEVEGRQPDRTKEQRGPSIAAAYGPDGAPSQALLGFCRSQGVDPSDLRKDGEYVWATKLMPGKATAELLSEILPAAVRSLTFEKTMRWGSGRMRFARPIRWILATFDGQVVEFEVEGVRSGGKSRGHRFRSPEPFDVTNAGALLDGLRQRFVEPDPAVREGRIREGAQKVAHGVPEMSAALVEENMYLTEWPEAVEGDFPEEYLQLPEPVLVTAMAKHERFFPVRDLAGKLTNRFVSIRNGGVEEDVRRGNQWVLNARFNDAKFFYDEDQGVTLGEFLERTSGMFFHEKLGTVRERADRLADLAAKVAGATGGDPREVELARKAGRYAKADLATGLVSELPSLQGVIGGEYAKRQGVEPDVCAAIARQYDLDSIQDAASPAGKTALRLIAADNLDKLAGFMGIGLAPTGSSDPNGLRRAATTLIELAWRWPGSFPGYADLLGAAAGNYSSLDVSAALAGTSELFAGRYESLLDAAPDVLEAALGNRAPDVALNPRLVRTRCAAMEFASANPALIQTATRPINIVRAAVAKGLACHTSRASADGLESPEGERLLEALRAVEPGLLAAMAAEDATAAVAAIGPLEPAINAFFDATMVMVDDERVRSARLNLLAAVSDALLQMGDWTKLVIEG